MKELGVQPEAWSPFAEANGNVFQQPLLKVIAENHGKTVGQVMLRWLIQRNIVVIPKTVRQTRMEENFQVFDFELTPEEMAQIRTLDTGKSTIYDEMDPHIAMNIAKMKIHD